MKILRNAIVVASLFVASSAFAWSATFLGGNNWAIICANGTAWSYSGSSAGLDVVGPALCPAGMMTPSVPRGASVAAGIDRNVSVELLKNRREVSESGPSRMRTYPPHGYPCLGCSPCPGNPTEFCDNGNLRCVFVSPLRLTSERDDSPSMSPSN